jgi:hypothetical protein
MNTTPNGTPMNALVEHHLNENLPEGFKEEKNKLLSKLQTEPSEEAVKTYSKRKQINLDDAKARLEANYRKEVEEVEFKEVALRLSNAMKVISPKMMGLELREVDREKLAKEAVSNSRRAIDKVDGVVEEAAKMIANAEQLVTSMALQKVNSTLNLSNILMSMINLEEQNKLVYEELVKAQEEIKKMKENTLLSGIKRMFGRQ